MELGRSDVELASVPPLPALDGRGGAGPCEVFLGLPSWNIGPAAAGDRLGAYARAFVTVELNATFHAVPTPATVAGWAARAPAGFRFGVKAPAAVSHAASGWRDAARRFAEAWASFGVAAGPCFFQAPPEVSPRDLGGLLARVDSLEGAVHAVELRHPGWFVDGRLAPALVAELAARGLSPCVADTPLRRDLVHGTVVGPRLVLRLLGIPGARSNRARLEAWAWRAREAGLRELWLYLHQPGNVDLQALADVARGAFGDAVVRPVAPTPQLGLFG